MGDAKFEGALANVRRTGRPTGLPAYAVERAAIGFLDLPGGVILTLLALRASLFALVWASNALGDAVGARTAFLVGPVLATVGLMLISAVYVVVTVRSRNK